MRRLAARTLRRLPAAPNLLPPADAVQLCRPRDRPYAIGGTAETLSVNLVPHSTRREGTQHLDCEEIMREAHLDPTDRIQAFDVRSIQLDAHAGKIVFDLRQLASPDDGDDGSFPLPQPRQGNLSRWVTTLTSHGNDFTGDRFLAGVHGEKLLHRGIALPGVLGPARF